MQLNYEFINERFKEFEEKTELRRYPHGKAKKGFVMRRFNLETGQFVQGYGIGRNYQKRKKNDKKIFRTD